MTSVVSLNWTAQRFRLGSVKLSLPSCLSPVHRFPYPWHQSLSTLTSSRQNRANEPICLLPSQRSGRRLIPAHSPRSWPKHPGEERSAMAGLGWRFLGTLPALECVTTPGKDQQWTHSMKRNFPPASQDIPILLNFKEKESMSNGEG